MTAAPKSARRQFAATTLAMEAVVVFFAALVAYGLELAPVGWIVGAAAALALVCVVAAGMLRRRAGYVLGWIAQCLVVALGFVVPMMFVLAAVFGALWLASLRVGAQIDDEREARARAAG